MMAQGGFYNSNWAAVPGSQCLESSRRAKGARRDLFNKEETDKIPNIFDTNTPTKILGD